MEKVKDIRILKPAAQAQTNFLIILHRRSFENWNKTYRALDNCFPRRSQYPIQGNGSFVWCFIKNFSGFIYCKKTCMQENQISLSYDILGEGFKTELIYDIGKTKHFSVIIDESTDHLTRKSLAVVIKCYFTKQENVFAKILHLVPVSKMKSWWFFCSIDKRN